MIELKDTCRNFVNYLNTMYSYDYFYPNHVYIEYKDKKDIYAMQDKHTENIDKYYSIAYSLCVAIEGALFTEGIYTAFKDVDLAENLDNPDKKIPIFADDECLDFVTNFMDFYGDIKTNATKPRSYAKTRKDKNGHTILPEAYISKLNAIYDSIKDFALFGTNCTEYEIIADSIENINLDGTGENYWPVPHKYGGSMSAVEKAVINDRFDSGTHYYQNDTERIADVCFSLLCYNNGLYLTDLTDYAEANCESLQGDLWDAKTIAFKNLQAKYPDEYNYSFSYSESSELHYRILNDDTKAIAELKNVVENYEEYDSKKNVG